MKMRDPESSREGGFGKGKLAFLLGRNGRKKEAIIPKSTDEKGKDCKWEGVGN